MVLRIALIIWFSALALAQQEAVSSPARNELRIRGMLVNSVSGQPIANGKVGITPVGNREDLSVVETGADGSFVFRNLKPGSYTMRAERRGYVSQLFNQHEGFSSSVVVQAGTDSSDLIFRIFPECAISGTITDEAGEPVRGAQIMLYRSGIFAGVQDTRELTTSTTNDEGFYRFPHLAAGRYIIVATAQVWYAQYPTQKPHAIAASGAPVVRGTSGSALSEADDQESDGPSPLELAYPITFYAGTTDPSYASVISLTPGENFVADMALQPVKAFRIELRRSSKQASEPQFTTLHEKLGGFDIAVPTVTQMHSDGSREIVGVAPGRYSFTLASMGQQPSTVQREITVGNEGVTSSEEGAARVSVALEFDNGTERPADATLQLSQPPHRFFNQRVPAKGDVEFKDNVPLGRYELAILNAAGYYVRTITGTGARIIGRSIEIKSAEPVKLKLTLSRGQGRLTGFVLRDGKPFSGAMVVLVPSNPANNVVLFRRDQSNSDGSFSIAGVVPGRYTALAIERGWELEWLDPRVLKPYMAQGIAVEVAPNGKNDVKLNVQ